MNSKNKIPSLCRGVAKLTDGDFQEVDMLAKDQLYYCHPLKMGKASRLYQCGTHNQRVITKLRELRDTILHGKSAAMSSDNKGAGKV